MVSVRFQLSCLKRASETAESGQPRCSQTQWGDEPLTTDFHLKFISLLKPASRSRVRHEHKHLQLLSPISLYKSYALGFFFFFQLHFFFTTITFYCDKSQRSQAHLIISISSRGFVGSLLPCFKAWREIALLHKTVGKIKIPGKAVGEITSRGCKTVSTRHISSNCCLIKAATHLHHSLVV